MRLIPTRVHGIVDYLTGVLLIALPWLLGFADGGTAQWVSVIVGVAVLGLAAMTDFEVGLMRIVPMPAHLMVDLGTGLFLAVSPWLLGFSNRVWLPFLLIGAFEVIASLTTHRTPEDGVTRTGAL